MKLQLSRVMIGSALITFMLILGIAAATAADADQSEFVAIG